MTWVKRYFFTIMGVIALAIAAPLVHSVEHWRASPPFSIDTVWVVVGGGLLLIVIIGLSEYTTKAGLASQIVRDVTNNVRELQINKKRQISCALAIVIVISVIVLLLVVISRATS